MKIRPLIQKANPKAAMAKIIALMSAKWAEFSKGHPKPELLEQEQTKEEKDDDKPLKRGRKNAQAAKKEKVPAIKIKIGGKRVSGRRRPNQSSDEEADVQEDDDSDANFEAALEEAAAAAPKRGARRSAPAKAGKQAPSTSSSVAKPKRSGKKASSDNEDAYDTDHQDYCEVCQQGGEVILCDTCPRAYHLVCLEPELEEPPEGRWSCPRCEGDGISAEGGAPDAQEAAGPRSKGGSSSSSKNKEGGGDEHMEYCRSCKEGGDLLHCDQCPGSYHLDCVFPPISRAPAGKWTCPRCACEPLKGRVQRILSWKWAEWKVEDENEEDEEDEKDDKDEKEKEEGEEDKEKKKPEPREPVKYRLFFIKWHDMSYWHCSWANELQLDVFHPSLLRNYSRKNDMDEPPQAEDLPNHKSSLAKRDKHYAELEEKYYRYGIKPEWLEISRVR